MQLSERWFGLGSIVLAAAGLGVAAVAPPHPHRAARVERIDFRPTHCSGAAAVTTQVEVIPIDHRTLDEQLLAGEELDPYSPGLASVDVARCFGREARVEMMIQIAADGHVVGASHRPEAPTHASRCIARAVRQLEFPATGSRVAIRYAFTK